MTLMEKDGYPYRMVFTTAVPGIPSPGVSPESIEVGRRLVAKDALSTNAFPERRTRALQYRSPALLLVEWHPENCARGRAGVDHLPGRRLVTDINDPSESLRNLTFLNGGVDGTRFSVECFPAPSHRVMSVCHHSDLASETS